MCEGCPIESGMTTERSGMTERSEIPDQVGDDDREVGHDDWSGDTTSLPAFS